MKLQVGAIYVPSEENSVRCLPIMIVSIGNFIDLIKYKFPSLNPKIYETNRIGLIDYLNMYGYTLDLARTLKEIESEPTE